MITLCKKWPSWKRLQGLWLISSLLEQEIQVKPIWSWKKRRDIWIWTLFTFCLIVSWVFIIETITGPQIKAFLSGVWNLVSDLRKTYPADCQIMVSSTFPSHFCQFGVVKGAADLGGWVRRFWFFFCQNRLIQVSKSRLKHRTYLPHPKSSHLKVDFCIQLLVKFQILIHFL